MWARLVVAPWWVHWLLNAAIFAVTLSVLGALGFPVLVMYGWTWPVLAVLAFSLTVTALLTLARRPAQQSFARIVAALNLEQRSNVVRALRTGEAPADPTVLAAAIRVADLTAAYLRRVPRWQRRAAWLVPLLAAAAGVLEFVGHDARVGLIWVVLAVLVAGRLGWMTRAARRLPLHLELLRSAANASPQALSALDHSDDIPAAPPGLRYRIVVVVVVAVAAGAVGALAGYLQDQPSHDCRTADAAVNYIHAHPDMLDPWLIMPGGPGLDEYRNWSDQLVAYSHQVSAPELAPHLRRIAELSTTAVSTVTEARRDSFATPPPDQVFAWRGSYQHTIGQLIEADNALIPPCHLRR
ncbi:hypothetical protein [Mycobacterium sherrisii]|uniref:Integral membrane protein n=1 Tax=Mycobacterium sherrisii TaxID=243061 RepID=A0A1E3T0D7_9MYCO|nr:hypothetical protein [Mycobacterium sherrisii]MCV7028213.1 hypothetical protein [Mycobacterium sherrisii]ODR07922.1 hypothetical protein BHQ21_07560 [Mycobacterium sherrisii]ORW77822.1 hypothetical protein AWC25_07470 [Mycobacterium sherrisii]